MSRTSLSPSDVYNVRPGSSTRQNRPVANAQSGSRQDRPRSSRSQPPPPPQSLRRPQSQSQSRVESQHQHSQRQPKPQSQSQPRSQSQSHFQSQSQSRSQSHVPQSKGRKKPKGVKRLLTRLIRKLKIILVEKENEYVARDTLKRMKRLNEMERRPSLLRKAPPASPGSSSSSSSGLLSRDGKLRRRLSCVPEEAEEDEHENEPVYANHKFDYKDGSSSGHGHGSNGSNGGYELHELRRQPSRYFRNSLDSVNSLRYANPWPPDSPTPTRTHTQASSHSSISTSVSASSASPSRVPVILVTDWDEEMARLKKQPVWNHYPNQDQYPYSPYSHSDVDSQW